MTNEELVQKFNNKFKVGDKVWCRRVTRGDFHLRTVQTPAEILFHKPMVWFVEEAPWHPIDAHYIKYELDIVQATWSYGKVHLMLGIGQILCNRVITRYEDIPEVRTYGELCVKCLTKSYSYNLDFKKHRSMKSGVHNSLGK